ncbi:hypothetical protein ONZ45_g11716 [Pleurotus djamor]|nr:hypothetical protein ONZ45_g11716 [Pleurotus djamor]
MKLYLSDSDPRNTVFGSETDGRAMYIVDTPFKFFDTRVSKISKVVHGVVEPLAEIEWHTFASSRLRFQGKDVAFTDMFQRVGFAWRDRVFVGTDDREYKWRLSSASKLYLNDRTETPVARSHKLSLGIFGPSHSPYLEVFPEGEGILDMIIITFVYVEKLRRDNERRRRRGAAGGGGPGGGGDGGGGGGC